jgi:hypothetical protein
MAIMVKDLARLARRLFLSVGVINAVTIAGLLLTGLILFWTWRYDEWRVFVSALAGGLGVVLATIAGFIETKTEKPARWTLAIAAGIFTVFFAWYTTSDLTEHLKAKTELVDLQKNQITDFEG